MPQQITGVVITPSADGTTTGVQIGPEGYSGIPTTQFFDRTTFSSDHLFGNIRLRRLIGNYGELASSEFADALATGIRLNCGDYYDVRFTLNADGSYTVAFGSVLNGTANQTITVAPGALLDDTGDQTIVLSNIGTFLRLKGYTSWTQTINGQTAIQAVAAQTWWF